MRFIAFFHLIAFIFFLSFSQAGASSSPQGIAIKEEALRLSNNAVGKRIGDYVLIDQDGKSFRLKEFAGKPIVISFIYTSCEHICPTITMNLGKAIKEAGNDFGIKFHAVTIGFDVDNDTPERMKEYGNTFTDDFKNWRFVTSDRDTMNRMTRDFGFYYRRLKEGFDHLNTVTIINPNGEIYKHVYGINFSPREILDPLYQSMQIGEKGSGANRISNFEFPKFLNSIILLCYKYDESTGIYKFSYILLIARLVELIIVLGIIYSIWAKGIKSLFSRIFGKVFNKPTI